MAQRDYQNGCFCAVLQRRFMLEVSDLKAIAALMDEKFEQSEARMLKTMDERLAKLRESMEERIIKTENLLLGEMSFDREYLEKQITKVRENMERLEQYSRITKLESDNTGLMLRMIEDLRREMELLKSKIA